MIQSTMIRASAGSGKTFQLANRYLALMVLGEKPEKIIALTFTRKAAGEFTSRIMSRLAEGASSPKQAQELAKQLGEIIHGTESIPSLIRGPEVQVPRMDASFFQRKLGELIEVLDRLALSTLDSYFVRIVRNFYLELGLSSFELMEDAAISAERMGVMKMIFSHRRTRRQDRNNFIQSFKQATWGEEENRLCQTLENFIQKHQNRWLSAPDECRWGSADGLWQNGCPYPDGDIGELARELRAMLGEPYTPHKRYMGGWLKVCDILEQYQPGAPFKMNAQLERAILYWDQYPEGGTVEEKNKYPISVEMGRVMSSLIGSYIRAEIDLCMKRTRGLYAVMSAYEQRYQDHVRDRGRLCFSDLTMLLAGEGAMHIWDDDERNLIDFRLDARYDHWLLDEFQDTSRPQWQAVENLVDEIMQNAEGDRSVFVVGDSKQSIYGWRGGEPRLFDDLKKHYGDRLADWDMDLSFRSTQPVLDLVNTVCDLSGPKWGDVFPQKALERWVFHQHTPNKNGEGHALVIETEVDPETADADAKKEARHRAMLSLLEKLKPLERGMSCAILVRRNTEVGEIVDYLRGAPQAMPVASESETYLADGPIGSVVLDLFRWLRNPAHTFGQLHMAMSPLGRIIEDWCGSDVRSTQWQWLSAELAREGIQNLVERIISALREYMTVSPYGNARLDELQATAADFTRLGGSLDDWVRILEARSLRETSNAGMIQVMTIHKCKGLGFDMVILPELGSAQEFTTMGQVDVLERKGELGSTQYIIKTPPKDIRAADKELAEMVGNWEADQCYERFCNLYVALTRAKKATYCILDPVKGQWQPKRKYDDWIREATAGHGQRTELIQDTQYTLLYESGKWLSWGGPGQQEDTLPPSKIIKLCPPAPRISRKLASESKKYHAGELLGNSKATSFGNWVHQQFEQISWLDELPEFSDDQASRVVADCLNVAEIRAHFERPAGEFQLLREQPIETQDDGQWVSGVIDRALIHLDNGIPQSISIIDFKTDTRETIDSLRDKYRHQLVAYRTAMRQVTGVPESRISCYLLSTSLKRMIEVH